MQTSVRMKETANHSKRHLFALFLEVFTCFTGLRATFNAFSCVTLFYLANGCSLTVN